MTHLATKGPTLGSHLATKGLTSNPYTMVGRREGGSPNFPWCAFRNQLTGLTISRAHLEID